MGTLATVKTQIECYISSGSVLFDLYKQKYNNFLKPKHITPQYIQWTISTLVFSFMEISICLKRVKASIIIVNTVFNLFSAQAPSYKLTLNTTRGIFALWTSDFQVTKSCNFICNMDILCGWKTMQRGKGCIKFVGFLVAMQHKAPTDL